MHIKVEINSYYLLLISCNDKKTYLYFTISNVYSTQNRKIFSLRLIFALKLFYEIIIQHFSFLSFYISQEAITSWNYQLLLYELINTKLPRALPLMIFLSKDRREFTPTAESFSILLSTGRLFSFPLSWKPFTFYYRRKTFLEC